MPKRQGEGPPWPKDTAAADKEEGAPEISLEEVIENFGKPSEESAAEAAPDMVREELDGGASVRRSASGGVDTPPSSKKTRDEGRKKRGRGGAASKDALTAGDTVSLNAGGDAALAPDHSPVSYADAKAKLGQMLEKYGPPERGRDSIDAPSSAEADLAAAEARLRAQTTKFYAKENRLLRRGWDELKKTERAYDHAVYELARSRKAEGLNGLEIVRDVIKRGEMVKFEARREALNVDQRYALEKALGLIPKGNAWLEKRLGKNKARALRAFATAAVVTGVASTAGVVGVSALLGVGAFKFGQSLAVAVGSATAGAAAGSWFDRLVGRKTQEKARAGLETLSAEEYLTKEAFERTRQRAAKLIADADDQTRARKKLLVQAFTSLGLGAGSGALVSLLDLNIPFVDGPAEEAPTPDAVQKPGVTIAEAPPAAAPSTVESAPVPVPEQVAIETQPEASVPHAAEAPQTAPPTAAPEVKPVVETAPAVDRGIPESDADVSGAPLSEEAITAELNRQSLEGHAIGPAEEAMDTSVPDESLPEPSSVPEAPVAEGPADAVYAEPAPVTPIVEESPESAPADSDPAEEPVVVPESNEAMPEVPPEPSPVEATPQPSVAVSETSAPEISAPAQGESLPASDSESMSGAFENRHGITVMPQEPHMYAVADQAAPGGERLVMYGGDPKSAEFFDAARRFAMENPGKPIYFESGVPTMYNGMPQRWITQGIYNPGSGFSVGVTPADPALVGRVPNPETFIRKIG